MKLVHRFSFLSMLLVVSQELALGQTQEREHGTPRTWEHESSDLTVNARVHFGALPNGMRYAWMKNGEPKERCYVRLHVDAGSLAEKGSERGMAHFLEHMAFNGSEHFEAGTLVEWFQEHGMTFGADLNAFTSYSQTVYKLDLPRSDGKTLSESLTVLRDWADGLLLEELEVQKEKGVIDGEEAEGDSAGRRLRDRILSVQYEGSRYPSRDPIGVREVRDEFSAAAVRDFYSRWYRPENMTLAIVGDLGELDPTALIEEHFADFAAPDRPVDPEPSLGDVKPEERYFSIFEPEIPSVSIFVERLRSYEDEPDSVATRSEDIDLACARRMLNLRFDELVKKADAPFLSAGVSAAGGLEIYEGETLSVSCEPEKWREGLTAAMDELRRALTFGFQQAELDEIRAGWLRSLDEAVEREPTRNSSGYVSEILRAAENRYVPTSAATDRAILEPIVEELTIEACHAALAESWKDGVFNVYSAGALDLKGDSEALREAFAAANGRELEKGEDVTVETFAYASDPEAAGTIAAETHVEDLDVWLITFENGVRLNLKATDFKERQIIVSARLAEGLLTLEPKDYAIGWVGSQVFDLGGLGAHTVDELRRLSAGKRIGVGFSLAEDAFSLGGQTTSEDLRMQLELLCAYLSDPGWRDDGLRMLGDRLPLIYERLAHVAAGPLVLEFLPELFQGDRRFAQLPERSAIEAVAMGDVSEWLAPHFAEGPLEVTIVGDFDLQAAKEDAKRTLGVLPKRREVAALNERRKVDPPRSGLNMQREIETEDDKSLVFMVFPIDDGIAVERRRTLLFLGQVVQDRLRIEVREELGAAYSPGASTNPSETFPGVGTLVIQSNVDPDKVETLVQACLGVVRSLHENGVTQEEVDRLTEPILSQIRDAKRQNGFWVTALSEAQTGADALGRIRGVEAFYEELKAESLSAAAKRLLDPERASTLIVNPAEEPAEPFEAGAKKVGDGD
ncbi:MAG: hypothetical protein CMJ89_05925 [Planctomycetes bacterium]|jgi:zinc protease|nr:hypothetical protein [Planctomycetota bacterium]